MSREVETIEKKETTISLKPIVRNGWLPKGHDGEYKFTHCETWLVPHKNAQTGQRQTGLNEDQERDLEKRLRMPVGTLSKYNEDYWANYKIKVQKEGRIFSLDNPKDELDVLVLRANKFVSNSQQEVLDSPTAMFYLSSVEKEAEVNNASEKNERMAIKKFGQLSATEMTDVLNVYSLLTGRSGKLKITKDTAVDLIETTLYNKVKEDPTEFLRIIEDPQFKTRVLIDRLVSSKVLMRSGAKYVVYGGDTIGATLQDTIDYLEDPYNQEVLISLKSKLHAIE